MATVVVMPSAGNSVESCILSKWHKKKGEAVKKGEVLFTYETDKAAFEEESSVDGILLDIFYEEDDDVPVLANVCAIGAEGEDIQIFKSSALVEATEKENKEIKQDAAIKADTTTITSKEDKIKISPRAKKKAEKLGLDCKYASATGPYGRIIERDIENLYENGPVPTIAAKEQFINESANTVSGTGIGGRVTVDDMKTKSVSNVVEDNLFEDVKHTTIRKVIAKSMYESISQTAQLTLNTSFNATEILEYRKKIKAVMEKMALPNITLNDIILYAVSRVLLRHQELNAYYDSDKIRVFNTVNLGLAVDTPRGLIVPTIMKADKKSLSEISIEANSLNAMCQSGNIYPDYLKDGTFTVTNLGALNIESFTPILNPPQTGILGVCNIVERIRKKEDGAIDAYPSIGLSLTFDHRAIDGAPAARFLHDLSLNLENFTTMLVK